VGSKSKAPAVRAEAAGDWSVMRQIRAELAESNVVSALLTRLRDLDVLHLFDPLVRNRSLEQGPLARPPVPKQVEQGGAGKLTFGAPEKYAGAPVRQNNARLLAQATRFLPESEPLTTELALFLSHQRAHKARYDAVATQTAMPTELLAAIHWREASGRFDRNLSNGWKLTEKSEIEPRDGPYLTWEESALWILKQSYWKSIKTTVGLEAHTRDLVILASFAECWNGVSYSQTHGIASPYVFSGTDVYVKGKFLETPKKVFVPDLVDRQIGVVPMLVSLLGVPVQA
jgi:lysozyme family protein